MISLTFKIELEHPDPKITRSFTVSPLISMYEMDHIIQIVMGWTNSHIYQFKHVENIIADTLLIDDQLGPVIGVKDVILPAKMCQFV
jgi:hypothetical protein